MESPSDIIVVGSGVSAVHAAWPLVKAGRAVTMLDVGYDDNTYEAAIPDAPFTVIRQSDPEQYRYFLGNNFEGISYEKLNTGPQVTPPRKFVLYAENSHNHVESYTFHPAQSFAIGGLSRAWGAVCHPYLDEELVKCFLDPKDIRRRYGKIAKRIGISGNSEDLEIVIGDVDGLQPPMEIDSNAEIILSRYKRNVKFFNKAGIYIGRPLMAVLTEPLNDRMPNQYHDMDFWSNKGGSVYRADCTVRDLQNYQNFTYRPQYLVETFTESQADTIKVRALSLKKNIHKTFEGRRLVLAAGALGTTQIVLRSLNQYNVSVPLICNPHTYIPCINYRSIGKNHKDYRHSLAQLAMLFDPTGDRKHLVSAQIYSYRSLLLFKLIRESIFSYYESLRIIRALAPYLTIIIVQHEDKSSPDKYCVLRKKTKNQGDYLEIVFEPSDHYRRIQIANENKMLRYIRKLGCIPIKKVITANGSSIHYAGQFPMTTEDKPLTTEPTGRLRGTKSVYIADGAVFGYLPAKGLTFTLMANADRIGNNLLRDI